MTVRLQVVGQKLPQNLLLKKSLKFWDNQERREIVFMKSYSSIIRRGSNVKNVSNSVSAL
jgi:hypothetical protein